MPPRVSPRDALDWVLCITVGLLLACVLFGVPAVLVFLATGSRTVALLTFCAAYMVFLSFSVQRISLSPSGIRFDPFRELRSILNKFPPAQPLAACVNAASERLTLAGLERVDSPSPSVVRAGVLALASAMLSRTDTLTSSSRTVVLPRRPHVPVAGVNVSG